MSLLFRESIKLDAAVNARGQTGASGGHSCQLINSAPALMQKRARLHVAADGTDNDWTSLIINHA
jgi:hypothetical protein